MKVILKLYDEQGQRRDMDLSNMTGEDLNIFEKKWKLSRLSNPDFWSLILIKYKVEWNKNGIQITEIILEEEK